MNTTIVFKVVYVGFPINLHRLVQDLLGLHVWNVTVGTRNKIPFVCLFLLKLCIPFLSVSSRQNTFFFLGWHGLERRSLKSQSSTFTLITLWLSTVTLMVLTTVTRLVECPIYSTFYCTVYDSVLFDKRAVEKEKHKIYLLHTAAIEEWKKKSITSCWLKSSCVPCTCMMGMISSVVANNCWIKPVLPMTCT